MVFWSLGLAASEGDSLKTSNLRIGFLSDYGFIIPHRPHMKSLVRGHSPAIRLHAEWQCSGEKDWHQVYGKPYVGVEWQLIDLGNPEQLGYSNALYSYIRLPLNSRRDRLNDLRIGVGLVYLSKQYDIIENGKNLAIGSPINGAVIFQYLNSIPLNKRLWLSTGIGITHFSNAAYQVPNLGMNLATVSLGLEWMDVKSREPQFTTKGEKQKNGLMLSTAFGVNENFPPGGPKFLASNFGVEYGYGISPKSTVQARVDLFYSEALYSEMREDEEVTRQKALQSGVAIGYGLHFGAFMIRIQTGLYLVDSYRANGIIYNRFGFQRSFGDHFVAHLGIKTHFAKAQNFELGCGWKF